jgi:hypothetical protein
MELALRVEGPVGWAGRQHSLQKGGSLAKSGPPHRLMRTLLAEEGNRAMPIHIRKSLIKLFPHLLRDLQTP